ncbi:MAG: NAD-dependent epimerase/dehydratase family protein [Myxococcota bacterium]|nr:NAD-dependent epimerase/dehydratase family protein [Myxococcota bacterium]
MKVIVFGGSGFLGSYVVEELLQRGHEVTVFDRQASPYHQNLNLRFIQGDLLNRQEVSDAVAGQDAVYNFAGQPDIGVSLEEPVSTLEVNVLGNIYVLEACREHDVKRFVYASTAYVFSQKGAFYGTSKKCSERIIEEYHQQFGLPFTIVRYGSVYGERADGKNRIYRLLHSALLSGRIVFPGDGSEVREYIHGRDAAKLSVDILDTSFENQHIILTGNERYKYSEVLELIREIMQDKVEVEYLSSEYKGHYKLTPYSFNPTISRKLVNNPGIDFSQGILHCIEQLYDDIHGRPAFEGRPEKPSKTMVLEGHKDVVQFPNKGQCLRDVDVAVLAGKVGSSHHDILAGKPLLLAPVGLGSYVDFLLDWLVGYGAQRVVFCLGEGAEQVREHFRQKHREDIEVELVVEPSPQGTAGALRFASGQLNTETVLTINGDTFVGADLNEFMSRFKESGLPVSMVCTQVEEVGRFGLVELDDSEQRISGFWEKPNTPGVAGMINAGIYLFSASMLKQIERGNAKSLEKDILEHQLAGTIGAYAGAFPFCDIGIPEDLARAHELMAHYAPRSVRKAAL